MFPTPIKLEIPGWSGVENEHKDGDAPQPWHCPPFVDASTYGLELKYPFETECHVKNINGKLVFEGDFSEENKLIPEVSLPPFLSFADNHFGMTSALDIKVPEDHVLRTEPHPAFYTDTTGTFPCCVPGHIQTYWWPKIFFVVFKSPRVGCEVVFKKNMPYGQVLVVPKKVLYEIDPMSEHEAFEREKMNFLVENNIKSIAKNSWIDIRGNNFSDKYKQLSSVFAKKGYQGVKDYIFSFMSKLISPSDSQRKQTPYKKCPIFRMKK